jgi:hypothetical protein
LRGSRQRVQYCITTIENDWKTREVSHSYSVVINSRQK